MSVSQVWFLRSALVWLVTTGALGVYVSFKPGHAALLAPTHAHVGMVGFFLSMVMGVAFWMLPRPGGLRQPRAELITLLLLQSGLLLRVIGEPWWRATGMELPQALFRVSGALVLAAMLSFAAAAWRRVVSIDALRAAARPRRGAGVVEDVDGAAGPGLTDDEVAGAG